MPQNFHSYDSLQVLEDLKFTKIKSSQISKALLTSRCVTLPGELWGGAYRCRWPWVEL